METARFFADDEFKTKRIQETMFQVSWKNNFAVVEKVNFDDMGNADIHPITSINSMHKTAEEAQQWADDWNNQ